LPPLKQFQKSGGKIVYVDTGSTDTTSTIAREYGCIVEEVGEKFITTIDSELANKINKKFIVDGEKEIVKEGDRLFDYSSARNYAASLSPTDFVAMPDCVMRSIQ